MTSLEVASNDRPAGLWVYVAKLLRLRWVIFASGFRRGNFLRKALTIGAVLLVLGVSIVVYTFTTAVLGQLDSPVIQASGIDLAAIAEAIPVVIVSGVFVLTLLTSFRVLLQALYLAKDMDFLVAAPLPIRAVFLAKLLEATLPNLALVAAFGLPVLLGLGTANGYHGIYYPLVFVVLGFLSFAGTGIASLLVMVVVRVFPPKRVAEVLTSLGAVLALLASQSGNLIGSQMSSLSPQQLSAGSELLVRFNRAWFPLTWGGRALVDLGQGHWLSGTLFFALTTALSGGVFWIALGVAERLYYTGWTSLQASTERKRARRKADRRHAEDTHAGIAARLLPPEVRAIVTKDFRATLRDLTNLSQMIGPLIGGVVFAVMLLRGRGGPPAARVGAPVTFTAISRSAAAYGGMAISLFVGWGLLSRLALTAFSMEGKNYWIVKTAPVSAGKQLIAKFLTAYLPALGLSWIYLLGIALVQSTPFTAMLYGLPAIALTLAGLAGINLAIGVRGANLTWTDPRQMQRGIAGCLGLLASIAYQIVALGLFFTPAVVLPLLGISECIGMLIGLLVGGTVAVLFAIVPLRLVRESVYRIGEA